MLTTTSSQIFGERGAPGVEVPLTQRPSSGKLPLQTNSKAADILTRLPVPTASGDCSIALLIDGPPPPFTRYKVWGAAVAVAGMCVPSRKLGTATVQCMLQKLPASVGSHVNTLNSREFHSQRGLWKRVRVNACIADEKTMKPNYKHLGAAGTFLSSKPSANTIWRDLWTVRMNRSDDRAIVIFVNFPHTHPLLTRC